MSENHHQQLIEHWKAAFGQYDTLKVDAESAIVRWEWTTGDERYSLLPFYFQRFDERAPALTQPPASKAGCLEYGLDREGRPCVTRRYGYSEEVFETFYRYADNLIEMVEFSLPSHIPLEVELIFLEQGQVTRHTSFQVDWAFLNEYFPLHTEEDSTPETIYQVIKYGDVHLEDYLYEGKRLVRIFSHYETASSGTPSGQVEELFTYDEEGKLQRIEWVFSGGVTETVYQKDAKSGYPDALGSGRTLLEKQRQQIIARWKAAFGQYDALKPDAESAVVQWEWVAGGQRYSPLPFYFQRFARRARAVKKPPTSKAGYLEYGLDQEGQPRVARGYGHDGALTNEIFYRYANDLIEVVEFSVPRFIPLQVEQLFLEQGQIMRHARFQVDWAFLNWRFPLESGQGRDPDILYHALEPNGRTIHLEDYIYEDKRLVRSFSHYENPTSSGGSSHQVEERFTYDEAGKLQRIEWVSSDDGTTRVMYQNRAKGETFQSIRIAAVEKMIAAIIARLQTAQITERLYCVELSYILTQQHFPPFIVLGLESRRQALLASHDPNALHDLFVPVIDARPDNGLWLEITDPDTLTHCQRLEQEIQRDDKWTTATRILRDIAATLTHYDWTGILDVTPDFVVFAIDHEIDNLETVLRISTSKEQVRAWKKKGWL